jgi:hypothetical protein
MNNMKNILAIILIMFVAVSCKKTTNDDISFLSTSTIPKDLTADVVVATSGIVTITPKATGAGFFNIYFGDNSAAPGVVQPGKNITHGYSEGNYTIKVVAKNLTGDSIVLSKPITVITSQMLVDFETTATTYPAIIFGGASFDKIANTQSSGINTSANVGRMIKGNPTATSEVWGGLTMNMSAQMVFSSQRKIKMKVFSNRVGAKLTFKLEAPSAGSTTETNVTTTVANAWEELTFVMDPSVIGRTFGGFSVFYELGIAGNGSANFTVLFDDIKLLP